MDNHPHVVPNQNDFFPAWNTKDILKNVGNKQLELHYLPFYGLKKKLKLKYFSEMLP